MSQLPLYEDDSLTKYMALIDVAFSTSILLSPARPALLSST